MFLHKMRVKREIESCKREIQTLERKLSRSQSSCLNALLEQAKPSEDDIRFHNKYMSEIAELREKIRELTKQLDE